MESTMAPLVSGWVAALAICGALSGQAAGTKPTSPEPARKRPKIHKESNRLVKLLELPNKRADAARRLMALGSEAVPELARGLAHPRIEVVRTIAHILRTLGSTAAPALPTLRKMAKENDRERAFTAKWAMARVQMSGRTILADYADGKVVELDEKGEVVHTMKAKQIWNAERLANGNYLVCTLDNKEIREIDADGKTKWSTKIAKNAMDAERLPGGNTLIADYGGKKVLEIDAKGKIVWQFKSLSPYDADRLASGNTLIADYMENRVFEVTPKGKVVWEYKDAKGVLSAERLPGGTTLMALYGGKSVREVSPKGKTVWSVKTSFNPDCALRLPNGHTLVGTHGKLCEYDRKGKLVKTIKVGRAASVDRF